MKKHTVMDEKEKTYLKALVRDYGMTINAIRVKRFQGKESYEQIYKRLDKEEKLILELQYIMCELTADDIKEFWNDKKNSLVSSHSFIRTLFCQKTDKPISSNLIKTCINLLQWMKDNEIVNS